MKINSTLRRFCVAGVFLVFFLAVGSVAVASGGGEKHWSSDDWIRVMNFVVLITLLFVVLRKPVANALNGRIEDIKTQLLTLENQKKEAEAVLLDYEEKIATLEKEKSIIEAQYKEQGEAARKKIIEAAKKSAEKLETQAKKNIENEFQKARQELQSEILIKAIEQSEEIIKKAISSDDQERLIDDYLDKVVA